MEFIPFRGQLAAWRSSRRGYSRRRDLNPRPLHAQDPVVSFHTRQVGLYAQGQWAITPREAITFGLRVDIRSSPCADRATTTSCRRSPRKATRWRRPMPFHLAEEGDLPRVVAVVRGDGRKHLEWRLATPALC